MDDENEQLQGSYTDHHMSPYQRRFALEPMGEAEQAKFNKIIDKMEKQYKETRLKDLIEFAIDDGLLMVDKKGMLRVTSERDE